MRGFDHRHTGHADAVLGIARKVGFAMNIRTVSGAAHDRRGVNLDLGQLLGQQLSRSGLAYTPHEQVVEVADHNSEAHKSELQSPMRIAYAVFCYKKNTPQHSKITSY